MITAKNYAAQACKSLQQYSNNLKAMNLTLDAIVCDSLIEEIKQSQHFAMPDYGILFDDNLKGITNTIVRLPFPSVTLEYFVPIHSNVIDKYHECEANKRLILAREITKGQADVLGCFSSKLFDYCDICIVINAFFSNDHRWTPAIVYLVIPCAWDKYNEERAMSYEYIPNNVLGTGQKFAGAPFFTLPQLTQKLENAREALEMGIMDLGSEIKALMEFLEALSCRNVETTVIQAELSPKIAKRRENDNKAPIFETKCLTIKTNSTANVGNGVKVSHASPKQHLRRGHIRHLESGNIWVNSCIVGDPSKGVIKHDYKVT